MDPIIFVDSSDIREGKLEELKVGLKELVDFVETNESRPIAYDVFLDEESERMTVVQVHPDSESMEYHMKTAASAFPKFVELLKLSTMDIYGRPSEALLELIRQKVELLGDATIRVHDLHAGFFRLGRQG